MHVSKLIETQTNGGPAAGLLHARYFTQIPDCFSCVGKIGLEGKAVTMGLKPNEKCTSGTAACGEADKSPIVLSAFASWAPQAVLDTVAGFSFLTHFQAISRGVIDLRDLLFFGSLIVCFLIANAIVVDMKKTG